MKMTSRWHHFCLAACIAIALPAFPCHANTSVRIWTLLNERTFSAELVSYDEATGIVRLRIDEKIARDFPFKSFSLPDQAWLVEWKDINDELHARLKELGGSLSMQVANDSLSTTFWVYRPSKSPPDEKLPMFILFSPNGDAQPYTLRFMEMAESVRCTVVCSSAFRNTDDSDLQESQMLERFRQLLPFIETAVAHDPNRLFLGGSSGGAERAYHFAALIPGPWAGIFANGGWLGGQRYYNLPYPPKLRVAMVNGNSDVAANQWVDPDGKLLAQRGDEVSIMSFEGAHQIPPSSVQIKAAEWLLNRRE